MLADKDRIFTNIHGFHDWGLQGALKRGSWDNTKTILETGRDWIVDQMKAATTGRRFIEADARFHESLALAAGNRLLAAVLTGLQPLLLDAMTLGLAVESATTTALSDHQAIVDAIERHDGPAAHMAMRVHLLHGRRELELAGSLKARR